MDDTSFCVLLDQGIGSHWLGDCLNHLNLLFNWGELAIVPFVI
jgi:hypothetical protein